MLLHDIIMAYAINNNNVIKDNAMEKKNLKIGKSTIYETLSAINTTMFLPAIQRKLVWSNDQITRLFDSIMRDYPIGTFLYWRINTENIFEKYSFYDFIKNYNDRQPYNEVCKSFNEKEILGVLDGQQRMSALYIGIKGSITRKQKYVRQDSTNAYEKTELYFNALSGQTPNEGKDIQYEFKFLTEKEAEESNEQTLWVKVSDIYSIESFSKTNSWLRKKGYTNPIVEENISLLATKLLADDNIINYFEISSKTMDEVLDIFIRVNSGGKELSKGDLLFSTIVSQWDNARKKFDELIKELNDMGQGFNFGTEEIITTCLYLMDLQTTLKVANLNSENIDKIKNSWEDIQNSLILTVKLLSDFGYCKDNLTSKNAILPLTYYVFKSKKQDYSSDYSEMRKYLLIAQAKSIFHASSDQVLNHLRSLLTNFYEQNNQTIRELKHRDFKVEYMISADHDYLLFTEDDLQDVLDRKKSDITFTILTILDQNFLFGEKAFHQDHCHPRSLLTVENLTNLGLSKEDAERCEDLRDRLPNLQILEGRKNGRKYNESFISWYNNYTQKDSILCLPTDVSFETKDFLNFYEKRRNLLELKLRELFGLPKIAENMHEDSNTFTNPLSFF